MKYSKTVNVTSHDIIKGNLNRKYDVYTNRVVKNENDYFETNYASKDFACQYDSNRDAVICTCKRFKAEGYRYFNTSRQVYTSQRYTSARGFADVGVGSVKTLPRKRVRRIYLPDTEDRGVGSSDLTPFIRRTRNGPCSYYEKKKTSSKCVGNTMEYNIPVINEKLSPIIKTKSGSTSPQRTSFKEKKNIDNHYIIPDSVLNIVMVKKHVRGEKLNKQGTTIPHETLTHNTNVDKNNDLLPLNIKSLPEVGVNEEKTFSSDSLLQHIHNLENTSSFKHSKTSIDSIIENKLEKEYLKKFLQISKQDKPIAEVHPVQDCSNESLQRRFEALRRGSIKKEVSVEHAIVNKSSSQNSTQSRKDVSISSDPPSLEARSYTDAKIYSPVPSTSYKYEDVPQISYGKSMPGKKRSSHLSTDIVDNDFQNVKGMFKLWEKKFNFEEDCYKKTSPHTTQDVTAKQKKKVELVLPKEEVIETQKKEGKKFSFFKRKNKERGKQSYKSKKGVTAGRCEVGDGLTIRIGAANEFTSELARSKYEQIPDDDLLRKAWLKRCLDNKNDSRNSVKIRWNNEMYATSSSTVFELMECIYKNTGILYTSRSEMTTSTVPATSAEETPYYHAENQQVNFMQQTIQAWMISKMMTDKSIEIQKLENKNDIEDSFSNQKWFIDKSKAFSQKIELVLHSKNFVKDNIRVANSSDYIVIDIPTGYFFETSSEDEQTQSSDEQVFNIVEYETAKSISYLNKIRNNRKMDISANENDIDVIVNVNQNEHKETNILKKEIEIPLLHRDVVVQGSNVYVPKRHDVVSVGIITQHTHNMDIQKPILRIQDEMTDDESTNTIPPQTKCKLAESYLQDYYRHWMPLGTDLYSWCSDSNLRASSDNNSLNSFNNQGDGSKSCPNIYDDYQASAIVSSCTTSSRSQCMIFEKSRADDTTTTYFNKLKKNKDKPQLAGAQGKRVLPKDSVEVFKRRKIYAVSKVKANWCADKGSEPLSKPSNLDKFAQKISNESICETKKKIKKHVSLKDFKKVGESIMSFKGSPGCKNCKTKEQCSKHALIMPEPMCEMVPPPCLDSCAKTMKPPCSKKGAPTCHVPAPPICPEGPPPPCQPACPPISPPCASFLEGNSPSPAILPPSSPSRSFSKLVPCSPPSSQQKVPLPSPHTLSPHLPPTAKPRPFARFFSRCSKQKAPCVDSCSKLKKPPSLRKDSSPCASLEEANSPSPPRSPPPRTKFSSPNSQETPPCKNSCSKLKKPPCSTKSSSPCASVEEESSPSPPRLLHHSNPSSPTRTKLPSPSSHQKPACKGSCSKLKKPPCSMKNSSPCASLEEANPLSPPRSPPPRTKFSSPNSQETPPCKNSCSKLKKPPCSTKSSSPCASVEEESSPSPPRSLHHSNPSSPTRTKFPSQGSQQKPPCKGSCSKLKRPPCSMKNSSPCASLEEANPQSPPHSPPYRTKFSSPSSQQTPSCKNSCSKLKKPPCSTKSSSSCESLEEASAKSPSCSPDHGIKLRQVSPSSQQKPPCKDLREAISPSPLRPVYHSNPRSPTRTKCSSQSAQQKPLCKDSCSKLKKPVYLTKNLSPCASLEEASSPLPPRSPTHRTKFSSLSSQQKPPSKDSCSKLKKPPCSRKSSSPSASLPERSSPSPLPLFPPFNSSSPTRTKLSSQSSEQKPLCKDSFEKEKMPPHETTKVRCPCFPNPEGLTSLPKRHIHPTKSSPLTTPRDPTQVTQACGCNSQKSCGLPLCLSIKTSPSSSQEFPCPFKNQLSPNNSGISIKDSLSNKYIGIFKRLISKCSSLTTKKESGDCEYPRETKVKKKETSVPPISLIPPLPFCQPTSPKPRSHSKMSGVHLKKLPMPRNSSNERKPSCEVIKLNSKESLTIRMKPKTPSTEAIREDCNVKVVDEDGQTLYERREYKMDTVQARKHLVQDTYRDSQIHRVSTPNMDITNEKNVHLSEHKSKTSLSNIVEINLTIKLKQADKTTGVSIKRYDDTPKNSQNEKVNSQEFKDVYTLQDQSIDRIVDAEKRDVSIKIIINSYQQNLNKSKGKIKHPNLRADEEFSRKISEKFHTVSTGYSDVLDEQSYSVHRTTVNFTDYSDTSNHIIKPSEELVSEGLIEKDQINLTDIECETKHSKSEPSVTLVTVNKTEKEDGPALPSDISQVDDNVTNLENIFDTFNEKSATGISATDNEEALFSDFQHSDAKIPKLRNKEEKKKMLKFIFEDSMKSKNTPNKSKMKSIQKLLRAALTSDKSGSEDDSFNHEVAKELAYESLKPNFFKNSESMTNYYRINSSNSDNISSLNEIDEIFHPTEINKNVDSAKSINEESRCLCSHFAAKLNICEKNNFKACCCRGNAKRDEEIDCNLIEDLKTNEAKFVDVETQDSNLKEKEKKLGITIGSNTAVIKPREVKDNNNRKLFNKIPKRLFSYSSNDKACKSNRQTILGLSEDDKVIVLNSKPDDSNLQEFCTNSAKFNPIDILQLYETKKAVLDIYAEKTEFNETSEHLVAKLPRFICQTESGICNYEERFRFS
ncbi:uncharacterized protein [Maniola hyperantus]|uniref:uncharacterized protein n=1 Tax=Aphantopus hyperantus TaxID=2795564 RepID=UPI003749C4D2